MESLQHLGCPSSASHYWDRDIDPQFWDRFIAKLKDILSSAQNAQTEDSQRESSWFEDKNASNRSERLQALQWPTPQEMCDTDIVRSARLVQARVLKNQQEALKQGIRFDEMVKRVALLDLFYLESFLAQATAENHHLKELCMALKDFQVSFYTSSSQEY